MNKTIIRIIIVIASITFASCKSEKGPMAVVNSSHGPRTTESGTTDSIVEEQEVAGTPAADEDTEPGSKYNTYLPPVDVVTTAPDTETPPTNTDDAEPATPGLDLDSITSLIEFNSASEVPDTEFLPAEEKEFQFTGSDGETVKGRAWIPKSNGQATPAVLVIPGITGDRNDPQAVFAAEAIVSRGYYVITMDPPKQSSTGDFFADLIAKFLEKSIQQQQIENYTEAVNWLASQPEVDPNRIGFVGISWGADTGFAFTAQDARIKTLVSVVGGIKSTGDIGLSPEQLVPQINPRPMYLINATGDVFINKDSVATPLHNAALNSNQNAETRWLDTDHTMADQDFTTLFLDVADFLDRSL